MAHKLSLFGFLLVNTFALSVNAEQSQTIDSARIHLSDVSDGYENSDLASLDLGPAPPPGNSRLLSRAEVTDQLRAAGDDAKSLRMPASLRVRSAAKRWTSDELQDALTPKIISVLPAGVNFKSSKLNRSIVTSPRVKIGDAHLPRIPKHVGELTLTATVDLVQDDITVLRVPVTLVVQVTELATQPAVAKGTRVNLVIEHGGARVTALAIAMSDTELGATGSFRVASTQRILRARLLSPDSAQVVE
ncbi:MAG: flagella basal body P-ring formation protein FlgA [Pseudomonadota bacterium]